jgi:hypothetical protein
MFWSENLGVEGRIILKLILGKVGRKLCLFLTWKKFWWSIYITKLLIMQSFPSSCYFILLLSARDKVSHPYKTKLVFVYFYVQIFWYEAEIWTTLRPMVARFPGTWPTLCLFFPNILISKALVRICLAFRLRDMRSDFAFLCVCS